MNRMMCIIESERIESLKSDVVPAKAAADMSIEYLKGVQDGLAIAYDYITAHCVLFDTRGRVFSWPEELRPKGYKLAENMDIDIRH